jgi:hypothetical protein
MGLLLMVADYEGGVAFSGEISILRFMTIFSLVRDLLRETNPQTHGYIKHTFTSSFNKEGKLKNWRLSTFSTKIIQTHKTRC